MNGPGNVLSPTVAPGETVRSSPSTPQQRLYIRTMFSRLDFDPRFVCAAHHRFFIAASLVRPRLGSDVDSALCALSKREASALIDALKKEVPND